MRVSCTAASNASFSVILHTQSLIAISNITYKDFVTARNSAGKHICVLVCSLDGYTRILRKETHDDPLEAARALADGLISDAGDLFREYRIFPSSSSFSRC